MVAIVALVFLGVSAVGGGVPMILDPAGEPCRSPQSLLQYSPFHSYLIPGIILLVANGFLSLWVLWLMVGRIQVTRGGWPRKGAFWRGGSSWRS